MLFFFLINFSSETGFGGLPERKTDKRRLDGGQEEVFITGGIRSAMYDMQGGVSPSTAGSSSILLPFAFCML